MRTKNKKECPQPCATRQTSQIFLMTAKEMSPVSIPRRNTCHFSTPDIGSESLVATFVDVNVVEIDKKVIRR
jgi:hypothetical protein